MRKLLSTILIFSFNAYAVPPVAVNGERQANAFVQNIKVPNSQATSLGGINTRLETGNSNLLINPSFEASTASTSHTLTNATAADDTTHKTDGLKGIAVTPTSNGGGIKQSSTTNAAYLAGSQGVVKASVYTTGTDVHVCPLMNGSRPSDVTKYCALVPKSTTLVPMPEIIVPFIMDGTSNGYDIYSDTTTAFTVDEVSVGKSAPFQGVSGAKLLGTVTITGCASSWSTTSTTLAGFAAKTGCVYTTTGQAQAPSTMIPAIKFASVEAGDIHIEYEGLIYNNGTVSKQSYLQFSDGINVAREQSSFLAGTNIGVPSISQSMSYSTTQSNITLELKSKVDSGGTTQVYGTTSNPGVIKVWYFPPESRIYSQASQDTSWQACTFSTLAWQGLGTVTNHLQCAKKGQNLLMRGNFVTGTTSASLAQIPLPINFGSITASSVSSGDSFGTLVRNSATSNYSNAIAVSGASYFDISNYINTNSAVTAANGSTIYNSGDAVIFQNISIPIQGWQDYGVIVGRFVDTINDTGSTKPISKKTSLTCTSSSTIISQGLGSSWITYIGNIASGACAVVIPSGIFNSTPICQVTPRGNGVATNVWKVTESSATSISLYCSNAGANCTTGESVNVTCEGLGI